MRIRLGIEGKHRFELVDRLSVTRFIREEVTRLHPSEARRAFERVASSPTMQADLRQILQGTNVLPDLWRRADHEVRDEVLRRLSTGSLLVVRSDRTTLDLVQQDQPEPAQPARPAGPAQRREAPEPEEAPCKCENLACSPAFATAASSGAALVERSVADC